MYKALIRPLLFLWPPERAHHITFTLLQMVHYLPGIGPLMRRLYSPKAQGKGVTLWNLHFKNPVGLAAGFDKDGKLYRELGNFGFSFIEVGTVTPRAQPGNAQPRLFRLPQDSGLINRMGFNNQGVEALSQRLRHRPHNGVIIGGNIGKNKDTPNESADSDYRYALAALHPFVDYFAVNISSPNTPNLRALQEKEPLRKLLQTLQADNATYQNPKPLLLKIAPDLSEAQLDDIVELALALPLDGLIATNTTISRTGVHTPEAQVKAMGAGGLSGKPVRERSTEVIRYLAQKTGGKLPIIAVGGIFTAQDAREKLAAGASLVQVYTGFIYEGPAMVKRIVKGLEDI